MLVAETRKFLVKETTYWGKKNCGHFFGDHEGLDNTADYVCLYVYMRKTRK